MTLKARRRAAELALIDAARALVREQWRGYPGYGKERVLIEAVQDYDAVPLELPGDARTGTAHPLTSAQAGVWMQGERARNAAGRIVRYLAQWPNANGLTSDAIQMYLGMSHQTCSARVNELRNSGWIIPNGKARTRSGNEATVWVLSSAARGVIRAYNEQVEAAR